MTWQVTRKAFLALFITIGFLNFITLGAATAAPYASLVMDARNGKVLYARNADTKLHPASLTKMMTLYVAFRAIENGEISLNTKVKISRNAASEPPSKLGLRAGKKIELRYLIRAAAVKSANDAATAIGEAISGSERRFAKRMTTTARAMGMSRTTFKNAHGLTQAGHKSTARDMAVLGRRLLFDFPDYYNLFSRRQTDAGLRTVYNTNRKFLSQYRGADGIKTGYTSAAGYNLVSSARRGKERIVASVFGGRSTDSRNKEMARLLDLGFKRAPTRVTRVRPHKLPFIGNSTSVADVKKKKKKRIWGIVAKAKRPTPRPVLRSVQVTKSVEGLVSSVLDETRKNAEVEAVAQAVATAQAIAVMRPTARPKGITELATAAKTARKTASLAQVGKPKPKPKKNVVVNLNPVKQGAGNWSVNLGAYASRSEAERLLLTTALAEMEALDGSYRRIEKTKVKGATRYRARFVGLDQYAAQKACARISARNSTCEARRGG